MTLGGLQKTLRQAPLYWIALASALFVFALTRWILGPVDPSPAHDQALLDIGFVNHLRADLRTYSVVEGVDQTFGPRVLSRFLTAIVSRITGDIARAGVWLSLAGVTATFAALYALCRSIFPLRGFPAVVMLAFAGLGAAQHAVSPDPAPALGMALVTWGVGFFFSALDKSLPGRVFLSAILIGLAAYIRIELALIWVLLAMYLLAQLAYDSPSKAKGLPLLGMAVGGLLQVALILWPMFDRNLSLATSPVLPGFDTEFFFGGTASDGDPVKFHFFSRFASGFTTLATSRGGLGIFAGLLWPVGVVLSFIMNRHKAIPFFWVPFVLLWVLLLTLVSPVTGFTSFRECLWITSPLLLPFSVLPPMFVLYQWMQKQTRPRSVVIRLWIVLGLGAYFFTLVPTLATPARGPYRLDSAADEELVAFFENAPGLLDLPLVTDRPGLFLAAGKAHVHGLHGETNWRIVQHKTRDGNIGMEGLRDFLNDESRTLRADKEPVEWLVHLTKVDSDLAGLLYEDSEFRTVSGSPQPLFRFTSTSDS